MADFMERNFDHIMNKCKELLSAKGKEYADECDAFHNFNTASELLCNSPVEALAGMMAKHTVSIYDMCIDQGRGVKHSLEQWDEKICDHITYLILLRAMVVMNNQ